MIQTDQKGHPESAPSPAKAMGKTRQLLFVRGTGGKKKNDFLVVSMQLSEVRKREMEMDPCLSHFLSALANANKKTKLVISH